MTWTNYVVTPEDIFNKISVEKSERQGNILSTVLLNAQYTFGKNYRIRCNELKTNTKRLKST